MTATPTIAHHLPDELLVAYASGTLEEARSLLVASHLALCPACRAEAGRLEALGGALLEHLPPTPVGAGSLDALLARLDEPEPPAPQARRFATPTDRRLPAPLRRYMSGDPDSLAWRRLGRGVRVHDLATPADGPRARLLAVRPGCAIPEHTHAGEELVLVLEGGFTDATGHFVRGDVAASDGTVTHRPVADPGEECLCLVVHSGRLHLTGPLGRLLDRFLH